ncbi:conjugal transfer protein TraY [Serratia sp. OLJL1]|uniref:DotA/TraY family protein n=7 Tax=Gammaproteobacteria TaxID=1236 RepID=UPI000C19E3E1|nr:MULTISPECIES: DotA/TraY family protein [Enterobacterales]PII68431.1 conjugal transfer protein TraY [Serratia sp. OLJL1]PIJ47764.1 conjugal transfer protein TraY [Erwinia sp. OAMSP11]PIJ63883.1 conjugal transfer protein TraY [Erwinia sp. OLSSP12]
MKKMLILLVSVMLAGLSFPVLADNVDFGSISDAAVRSSDLSRQLLIMMFGDVVSNPLQPTNTSFIGGLFGVFNGVIAGLALIWFMGVMLRTLVLTGNRGKVFSGGNTMMAPVASLAGFMALIPTPSGWSIANLTFLWMTSIMGVGGANLLVDKAADSIMEGQSMIMQPVSGNTITAARGIFDMYLCQSALNAEQAAMHQDTSGSDTPPMQLQEDTGGRGFRVTNGSKLCGSVMLPDAESGDSSWYSFSPKVNTAQLESAQNAAFSQINTTLSQAASGVVSAYQARQYDSSAQLPDVEATIQQAARSYEDTINRAAAAVDDENSIRGELSSYLKQSGWLSLGAWYRSFATANQKASDIAHLSPEMTGPSVDGEVGVGGMLADIQTALKMQRKNAMHTPPLGSNMEGGDNLDDVKSPNSAILKLLPGWGTEFSNFIIQNVMGSGNTDGSGQANPLLKMKAVGDYTLTGAETTFAAFTVAKGIVDAANGTLLGKAVNTATGAGYIVKSVMNSIAPVVYFLLFILISVGFSLSILLPFIPLIYWIIACTNWVVSVLVGVVAGPLWAATHIGTDEAKGSRANYGYIFLIDAAIRPSLMVFGFFFASLVVVAIGTLLNILMLPAMANVQANSLTGVMSVIGILMIYARICTTLVSSAFSLQVYLPDYVIAWLGGRESSQMMRGTMTSAMNMFAGFGSKLERTPGLKKLGSKTPGDGADGFKL